jgi:hypothetical protein
MAQFIAAVHADGETPRSVALIETDVAASGVTYTVREVRTLDDDPFTAIESLLASESQYVGNTVVVTTGGQAAADALHARGPSAAAVTLQEGESSADRDALDVSPQVLVDTFEMLFRQGAVSAPSSSATVSGAIQALYQGADLDNAAPEGDRNDDGDLDASPERGPDADRIAQSGNAAALSTETVKRPVGAREASAAGVAMEKRAGRIAAHTGETAPDLGQNKDAALALALARDVR